MQNKVKYICFRIIPLVFILTGILLILVSFGPLVKDEVWFYLKEWRGQIYSINKYDAQKDSPFARFLTNTPVNLTPVNKDFSIIIEKIGVNSPIIADVSISDSVAYNKALRDGIAHASISQYPSDKPGNVYLFAHSSINFWELGKYATVFNLLRKLNVKDKIHVYYKQNLFIYEVVNKEVMKGWNVYPITRSVLEPLLTLQTCDPPGTTINRLVVTAKLKEVHWADSNESQ